MIYFNGVDADNGGYFREPMTESELRSRIQDIEATAGGRERALVDWADPDDLGQAGWGVISAENEDPQILEKIDVLLQHREKACGDVRHFIFTEEDKRFGDEAIDSFFDRYGVPPGDVDPGQEALPYYLLILGSPEKIPFSFQAELDITHASGRLWFEDLQGFANYASNIVAQEREPRRRWRRLTLFGTDNGDEITGLTSQYLVPPLAKKLKQIKSDDWAVDIVAPEDAGKIKLTELLAQPSAPALLMTAGHGAVSSKKALELQGALICSEWQGGKLAANAYFSGADVHADHDYRGLIAFFFACFSAGTPQFDSFVSPGKKPWQWHAYPFIGDLPQAMLGHKNGPLALIAHVDQAFQFSFLWNDNILGIDHFAGTFYRLMAGKRIGYAMEPFRRRYAAALASIKRAKRLRKTSKDDLIKRWIGYQDARYYAVLGDPAVRLPL